MHATLFQCTRTVVLAALLAAPPCNDARAQTRPVEPERAQGSAATPGTPDADTEAQPRSAMADLVKPIPRDFARLFTVANALVAGAGGVGTVVAYQYDDDVADSDWGRDPHAMFAAGQYTGDVLVNIASGLALYAIGRKAEHQSLRAAGSGIFRAQLVSQAMVQGIKPLVGRVRPDASNDHSFPSGHSATSFATATVLQHEWGWKAGLPAYGLAVYTGLSRIHNRRHFVSDVVFGATIGVLSGRAVTVGRDELTFALSVAPTRGGWRVDLISIE